MRTMAYRDVAAMRKTALSEETRNSLIGAGIGGLAGGGAGALGANILARLLDTSDENRRKATLLAGLLMGGAGAAQGALVGNIGTRIISDDEAAKKAKEDWYATWRNKVQAEFDEARKATGVDYNRLIQNHRSKFSQGK